MTHEEMDLEKLSALAERRVTPEEAGRIYAHLKNCPRCKAAFRDLCDWLLAWKQTEKGEPPIQERRAASAVTEPSAQEAHGLITRLLWRWIAVALMPAPASLAAADGQTADQRQQINALSIGQVHFTASVDRKDPSFWHAALSIPPHPTAETLLRLKVETADGKPISDATLILCGIPIRLDANGRALLPIGQFREHLAKGSITLERPNGTKTPGEPHLGYNETEWRRQH